MKYALPVALGLVAFGCSMRDAFAESHTGMGNCAPKDPVSSVDTVQVAPLPTTRSVTPTYRFTDAEALIIKQNSRQK